MWGTGEGKVISVLSQKGNLGMQDVQLDDIVSEASCFIAKEEENLSAVRYKRWRQRVAKGKLNATQTLRALPTTSDTET